MERLTEKDLFMGNITFKCGEHEKDCDGNCQDKSCGLLCALVKKFKEYEDLEEQGKLLKMPCAVGDTVWYWDKEYDPIEEAPFEGYISGYEIVSAKTIYIIINQKLNFKSWFPCYVKLEIDDFGKTVFLTREEAEATLKELEGAK